MAHDPGTPTAYAVSPDSGEHWSAEGAWEVVPGIHRIPLPLPMDGLKAVNVYALETVDDDGRWGLTLVDGGWHVEVARELLDKSLRAIGAGFGDIRRFLVTHAHRDHYTMASVLGLEFGAEVALGLAEKPSLDLINTPRTTSPFHAVLVSAGARDVAEEWVRGHDGEELDPRQWQTPTTWLEGDHEIAVGARTLDAVHTPGHTPGHFVFADRAEGLLFAGDHVLPTITPSIGFTIPVADQPLGDFMASLTKVRALPDLTILPAHGPVSPSSHARVDALLAHHEERLADSLAAVPASGSTTALAVAGQLGWTRHLRTFESLDVFNRGMAAMETKAHLDLLVARGALSATDDAEGVRYARRIGT